ncbi:MAG: tRNA (adenosine(37)-N6)-threonylcarbamoyltransferase complex dimerization subunit type 1 TsaB [Bacteroidales bacterium]|jgi:tRNA threonylcarbamoyladenosine biosynthesis protein TsaB|nr:tRNA (adenosine(37)-N6)-threonylcarbamoyltransferase complex dimerization subunit type 1 TsaB [Bacteroidales bacterium]MCK9499016.1 tRNA (adenosine(37)-N6)-threonylcarbamoyltransferase complex dimerization subunit type 1 TsaB [Bacteroidales bacterium]MDY0316062.1 tRNA (adenosine(37)-N6)-threonylcarbamoyltransferase complex dimerization subunit type 1 TsaB [Bacteroidales bacterium]NLB87349.1 tRNA (adenosine(37)-N6)-threonylcarbamoyltransferase complex dimerization subunit type 1 TsaB [Bacteroi
MDYILNIETSTDVCSVSISQNGETKFLKIQNPNIEKGEKASHSQVLAVFIQDILKENSILPKNIKAVAVSGGPGSYTGLRIGVSTAKGFATALDLPLIAIESLEIIAAMAKNKIDFDYDLIIPMIDARRMEVYTTIFDKDLNKILETQAKIIDKNSFLDFKAKKIVFCGNGAKKCKEALMSDNFIFIDNIFPSAELMSGISHKKLKGKEFVDLVYYEPFYLKDFVAIKPKNKLF